MGRTWSLGLAHMKPRAAEADAEAYRLPVGLSPTEGRHATFFGKRQMAGNGLNFMRAFPSRTFPYLFAAKGSGSNKRQMRNRQLLLRPHRAANRLPGTAASRIKAQPSVATCLGLCQAPRRHRASQPLADTLRPSGGTFAPRLPSGPSALDASKGGLSRPSRDSAAWNHPRASHMNVSVERLPGQPA